MCDAPWCHEVKDWCTALEKSGLCPSALQGPAPPDSQPPKCPGDPVAPGPLCAAYQNVPFEQRALFYGAPDARPGFNEMCGCYDYGTKEGKQGSGDNRYYHTVWHNLVKRQVLWYNGKDSELYTDGGPDAKKTGLHVGGTVQGWLNTNGGAQWTCAMSDHPGAEWYFPRYQACKPYKLADQSYKWPYTVATMPGTNEEYCVPTYSPAGSGKLIHDWGTALNKMQPVGPKRSLFCSQYDDRAKNPTFKGVSMIQPMANGWGCLYEKNQSSPAVLASGTHAWPKNGGYVPPAK